MWYYALLTKEGRNTLAFFPDCRGCQTQAGPGEDIVALATDALEGWLEANLVQGRVPPLPSTRRPRKQARAEIIKVPVPPALAARVQLRAARKETGLSQVALARKVGVTQQQLAALESPDSNVTVSTLAKVAGALDRDVVIEFKRRPPSKKRTTRVG